MSWEDEMYDEWLEYQYGGTETFDYIMERRKEQEEAGCSGECGCCPIFDEDHGICPYFWRDLVGDPAE